MQKKDISRPKVIKKTADDAAILFLNKKTGKIIDANIAAKKLFKKNIKEIKKHKLILDEIKARESKAETSSIRQQNEDRYIIDALPAWVFYKDKENRFIRVNQAFCDAIGKTKKQLEGKSLFKLFPKEQADSYYKDDLAVIKSEESKVGIIESIFSPHGEIWLKTDKILHRDEVGNIIGIVGLSVDITEQKISEQKLNDQISEQEKLNKLMIGRELKMIELKKEIVELKSRHNHSRGSARPEDSRFHEGIELEEDVIQALDHDYMTMIIDSDLPRSKKNIIVGYLEVLLLDSRKHEKALEDLS